MNISFITATLTSGGSERVVSLLANQLQQRGHQVEIVLLMEPIVFYQTNEQVKLLFPDFGGFNISDGMTCLKPR